MASFSISPSLNHFFLSISFLFQVLPVPSGLSLTLSPQGAAEFTALFLSLCTLFRSRSLSPLSFRVACVCIWGGWLMHLERGHYTQGNAECLWESRFFKIFYFNGEYQQMQKLKSNIHKIWSLWVSNALPLYPAGVLQDQVEAHSFKRSLAILFLCFISPKVFKWYL